ATAYTTIGPAPAGDVRRIDALTKDTIKDALAANLKNVWRLERIARGKTTELVLASTSAPAEEVVFALLALAATGYEPIAVRYFRLGPEGEISYLDAARLAAAEADAAKLFGRARADAEAAPFDDVEITFRKRGDAAAPAKTFRHIRAELDNAH